MTEGYIDKTKWLRCGKCNHKMGRLMGGVSGLEIKCHSCKEINYWKYINHYKPPICPTESDEIFSDKICLE